MNNTVRIGRIGGIIVRAHWSVLVIAGLIAELLADSILPSTVKGLSPSAYWVVGIAVCLLFLASLLAHEVSHALVARRHGIVVKDITLWMLGGFTALEGETDEASTALRVAVIGPLVSLLCGALSLGAAAGTSVLHGPKVVTAGFVWLGFTNGLLAVFNLLPGAPLDGGRVVQALLWRRHGDRLAATLTASRAGRTLGGVLVGLGLIEALGGRDFVSGVWLALIGWFLMQAAAAEARLATVEHDVTGVSVAEAMETAFATVASWEPVTAAARDAVAVGCDYCVVCDLEGDLEAVIPVDVLVTVAGRQSDLKVGDICGRFSPPRCTEADVDLAVAIQLASGALPIAAFRSGHLVGIVTPTSVKRAMQRRRTPNPSS